MTTPPNEARVARLENDTESIYEILTDHGRQLTDITATLTDHTEQLARIRGTVEEILHRLPEAS